MVGASSVVRVSDLKQLSGFRAKGYTFEIFIASIDLIAYKKTKTMHA